MAAIDGTHRTHSCEKSWFQKNCMHGRFVGIIEAWLKIFNPELRGPGLIWVNLGYCVSGLGPGNNKMDTFNIGFMGIRYDEISMEHGNLIPVA